MKLSETIIIALITATPPTIFSVASFITAWRGSEKVSEVAIQVEQVHKATNSLTDRLVASTRSDALKEGHSEGVLDEKIRSLEERKKDGRGSQKVAH